MNTLSQISLTQFRNYRQATFPFPRPVTCITGANGSGKTTLLDAAYYLCYTKSYFTAQQQHSVQTGTEGFRLQGTFTQEGGKGETVTCKWQAGKKEVSANGVAYEKIADHIGKWAAVMIAPDDLELINGGSEGRRRWIDSILGQTDRRYLDALLDYQRVLLQRNAWLKRQAFAPSTDSLELDFYNSRLDAAAGYLHAQRSGFMAAFLPLLDQFYHQLSAGREVPRIAYNSDLHERPLIFWLQEGLQSDLRLQRTQRGTHRDDLEFSLDGLGVKNFGSQGQKKSFLFALKLAQYAYLNMEMGHLPLLLLDDVFEKLDQQRMEALLRIIRGPGFGQVLLTDTHEARVREAFGEDEGIGFIGL